MLQDPPCGKSVNAFFSSELRILHTTLTELILIIVIGGLVLQDAYLVVNLLTYTFVHKLRICTGCCQTLVADGGVVLQESGKSVKMFSLSQTQKF